MAARIVLLSPVPLESPRGNAVTVARIAAGLRRPRASMCPMWEPGAAGLEADIPGRRRRSLHAFHAYHTGTPGGSRSPGRPASPWWSR